VDCPGDLRAGDVGIAGGSTARVASSQVFKWRQLYAEGALSAIDAGEEAVAASEYRPGLCSINFMNCNGCWARIHSRTRSCARRSIWRSQKTVVAVALTRAPLPRSTRRGFVATSVARRGRFFHFATLERDRGPAADEPDEALKRSLRELIVDDRGLIAFLSRHARR